jgi:hypothetical protein
MTVSTKFPTLVDAIITALGNASSLTGVRVFDGAQVDESYPGDAIAIGHDGSFGDTDIQAGLINNTPLDFTDQHQEEGSVSCSLWSMDGTTNITARRTRAFALLSAIDTVIRLDSTFGGVVFYTILESNSVVYRQTSMGVAVVLDFTIRYTAQS